MNRKKIAQAKLYRDDIIAVKSRFPNTSIADMFHQSIRTNPLIQLEAFTRKNVKKKK